MIIQKILGIVLIFSLFLIPSSLAYADEGWDYMESDLRVDISEVSSARDYRVQIATNSMPNTWDPTSSGTSAWLGVYILPVPTFFQVGVYVNNEGYHWFAMTDGGVIDCLEGMVWTTTFPYAGCRGVPNVYIDQNHNYQQFELYYNGAGYWVARVYDANGFGHDVARISSSNVDINRINVTFEQTWGGYNSYPYLNASFAFKHPQYMKWGTGFQNWPNSNIAHMYSPQTSYVYPQGTSGPYFCPGQYGAAWNYGNDPRVWYAGTTVFNLNILCNFNLFQFMFVPEIIKSP